jgi:YVTN family beta-propeller protein
MTLLENRKIKFVGYFIIIILIISTLGCVNSGSNENNSNRSNNAQVIYSPSSVNTSTNSQEKMNSTDEATLAYFANTSDSTVSVLDTSTNVVTSTVHVGKTPSDVVVSPDGKKAYVANSDSGNISIIDTSTNTVIDSMNVGIHHFAWQSVRMVQKCM